MSWRVLDHTADVAVEIQAADLEHLFAEALRAFTDQITEIEAIEPRRSVEMVAQAGAADLLLVEWLSEAVFRYETDGLLVAEAAVAIASTARGLRVTGRCRGERHDPQRHPLKVLIKGVTYHGLAVDRAEGGWRARVVFDI